jgi:kynurenine formamidase
VTTLWDLAAAARVVDLAQPLEATMPVSPSHPGFRMALVRRHGDVVREDGTSGSNELLVLGGHSGTHVDALCHVAHNGLLHGGVAAADALAGGRYRTHGVDQVEPVVGRGVLLDIAREGCLEPGEGVSADDLAAAAARAGVDVRAGDSVLVRTGWSRHWLDVDRYVGATGGAPGVDESGAEWLVDRGVRLTGSDTLAYERIPPGEGHARLPVHRILLVEAGVPIVEMMNLTPLAEAGVAEFLLVLAPLKIVGATGSPVRPLALVGA